MWSRGNRLRRCVRTGRMCELRMLVLEMQRQMPKSCSKCSFCDDVSGACLPTEGTDGFFFVFDFDRENGSDRHWKERDPRCPLKETPDMSEEDHAKQTDGCGTWLHTGTRRSSMFVCSVCGRKVYYQQANNNKASRPIDVRIMYEYCPYCLSHMRTMTGKEGLCR